MVSPWEVYKIFEVPYLVAPIEALFILSPLAFDRLHNGIIFCCMTLVPEVIASTQ